MTQNLVFLTLCCVCLVPPNNWVDQKVSNKQQQEKNKDWRTAEFRYLIYENNLDDTDPGIPSREVAVLLDEKAFSVDNLRKLLVLVSRRFPNPESLDIWIETNLLQIPTPEEKDGGLSSERGLDPHREKHPRALLTRRKDSELIRYTPGPPYLNMEKIVLK